MTHYKYANNTSTKFQINSSSRIIRISWNISDSANKIVLTFFSYYDIRVRKHIGRERRKIMYDIVLEGGKIIDPSQGINSVGSVAIKDGKIAALNKDISEAEINRAFDMTGKTKPTIKFDLKGKIVVPGLIDSHCHPVPGFMRVFGIPADEIGWKSGVTTVCDAGSSGAANFETLRRFIIGSSKTDVFCFLNLSLKGLITVPESWAIFGKDDINVDFSKAVVEANRNIIKGIKIHTVQPLAEQQGIKGVETAKKLATDLKLPLMVHIGAFRKRVSNDMMDDFTRSTISKLEKGDIICHYTTGQAGGMIVEDGTIYPELGAAQKRGVLLDICFGQAHTSFRNARLAFQKGLIPNIISTDLASAGAMLATQSLIVVMSMCLNMGVTLDQVIEMTTVNPAKELGEEKRRGSLKPGMMADITVLELVEGDYQFSNGPGLETMQGKMLLEPRMVFKAGEVMPVFSRYQVPPLYK